MADITGTGDGDLVVSAGFGGGPRVAVLDGKSLANGALTANPFGDFFAFEDSLRNGPFVTGGDLNGDGFAELIAGGGPDHLRALRTDRMIAYALLELGRAADAEARATSAAYRRTVGDAHPEALDAAPIRARCLICLDRPAQAVPLLERVVRLGRAYLAPGHHTTLLATFRPWRTAPPPAGPRPATPATGRPRGSGRRARGNREGGGRSTVRSAAESAEVGRNPRSAGCGGSVSDWRPSTRRSRPPSRQLSRSRSAQAAPLRGTRSRPAAAPQPSCRTSGGGSHGTLTSPGPAVRLHPA